MDIAWQLIKSHVTKVGVSYVDHMNDDTPEVDSFSRGDVSRLSTPPTFRGESLVTRLEGGGVLMGGVLLTLAKGGGWAPFKSSYTYP